MAAGVTLTHFVEYFASSEPEIDKSGYVSPSSPPTLQFPHKQCKMWEMCQKCQAKKRQTGCMVFRVDNRHLFVLIFTASSTCLPIFFFGNKKQSICFHFLDKKIPSFFNSMLIKEQVISYRISVYLSAFSIKTMCLYKYYTVFDRGNSLEIGH